MWGKCGTWSEAVLHRFSNGRDGAEPAGQLIFDSRGALLSTTYAGGRYASAQSSPWFPRTRAGGKECCIASAEEAMACIPWRKSWSAALAISRARPWLWARFAGRWCGVWSLCRNFQFHSTSCWQLRDQRPVAGDQWQQPPITW